MPKDGHGAPHEESAWHAPPLQYVLWTLGARDFSVDHNSGGQVVNPHYMLSCVGMPLILNPDYLILLHKAAPLSPTP